MLDLQIVAVIPVVAVRIIVWLGLVYLNILNPMMMLNLLVFAYMPQRLAGATLLVFANKQDLPGALSAEDIKEV